MPRHLKILLALPLLGFLAGCNAPAVTEKPAARIVQIADRDAFLDRAMTVLREHDFQPRRADRDIGLVVTWPSTSGQWFEFWRRDVHGAYQSLEASIHTIRREVTLTVQPVDGGQPDEQQVTVQVEKSRYSAPERQVTTASGALTIYSEHIPTEEGLRRRRVEGEHWVPLGRDSLLEEYLLKQILSRAGGTATSPISTTNPAPGVEPAPSDAPTASDPAPISEEPTTTSPSAPEPVGEPPPEAAQVEGG